MNFKIRRKAMGKDSCKECKKCLKEKVASLETQLANETKKVNSLQTQLANQNKEMDSLKTQVNNLTEENRRLIEKFKIYKEKLKKCEAVKQNMTKDLDFYKEQNNYGIKKIQLYDSHVHELEGRNAYYEQMCSASMNEEIKRICDM